MNPFQTSVSKSKSVRIQAGLCSGTERLFAVTSGAIMEIHPVKKKLCAEYLTATGQRGGHFGRCCSMPKCGGMQRWSFDEEVDSVARKPPLLLQCLVHIRTDLRPFLPWESICFISRNLNELLCVGTNVLLNEPAGSSLCSGVRCEWNWRNTMKVDRLEDCRNAFADCQNIWQLFNQDRKNLANPTPIISFIHHGLHVTQSSAWIMTAASFWLHPWSEWKGGFDSRGVGYSIGLDTRHSVTNDTTSTHNRQIDQTCL